MTILLLALTLGALVLVIRAVAKTNSCVAARRPVSTPAAIDAALRNIRVERVS